MPNLFHGSPVRVYGRYRGSGPATLALRGNLNGVEWKQSAEIDLPKQDATNTEIERMWAWRRIDALLKNSERVGQREPVVPEVVRLGEEFSIVTEYTSFLVLENDAELARWKIERRNAARIARDRDAQSMRETTLAALRQKAVADLGPQAPASETKPRQAAAPVLAAQPAPAVLPPTSSAPIAQAPSVSSNSQSRNFSFGGGGGGSGPVGPLFVIFSAWLSRMKRRSQG
jgi:Ca-activated chloride channel family protein